MAASVILGLAVFFLWARSYRWSDALRWSGRRCVGFAIVYSGKGGLLAGISPPPLPSPRSAFPPGFRYDCEDDPGPAPGTKGVLLDRFGFGLSHESPPYDTAACAIWIPHWFAALSLLAPPALYLKKRRTIRDRERAGLCRHCGYELRASPERCPECGAFIGRPAAASANAAMDRPGGAVANESVV